MRRCNLYRYTMLLFATLVAVTLSSETAQAAVKAPVTVNDSIADGRGKPTVLIYYANETHETAVATQNTDTILDYLRFSDDDAVHELADAVERDRTKFAEVVQEEIAAIRAAAGRGDLTGVVIFTNELVCSGHFEFCPAGESEFQTVAIDVPELVEFIDISHPLANAGVFQMALQAAAERFPPVDHEFVLITKSHGSPQRAMVSETGNRR